MIAQYVPPHTGNCDTDQCQTAKREVVAEGEGVAPANGEAE